MCRDIGVAANSDDSIMPVHRYRQARSAFSLYVTKRGKSDLVQEYMELRRRRVELWSACVKDAIDDCEAAFVNDDIVDRPGMRGHVWGVGLTECLRPVHIQCWGHTNEWNNW